eukprot:scaffold12376_cov56-Phaeocystis_antarctica.AAC.3
MELGSVSPPASAEQERSSAEQGGSSAGSTCDASGGRPAGRSTTARPLTGESRRARGRARERPG